MWLNPVEFFASFIERETGIVYSGPNLYQLQIRLEDICRVEGLKNIDDLARRFQGAQVDTYLKQKLLDIATNNETLFFRDPVYFTAIGAFLTDLCGRERIPELKIWSAAASTGQEALSVAMTLDELAARIPLPPVSIFATDICERAIAKSKSGLYTDFEVMRGLAEERRQKYFLKEGESWRVRPSLQARIRYGYNNLIRSSVHEKFHLILCRNVLIYQKVDMKKAVIEALYRQLDPCGAILLGAGETMVGLKETVESEVINTVTFYRKQKEGQKRAS
jgi:chemotaxis protein methyltransferase CheR